MSDPHSETVARLVAALVECRQQRGVSQEKLAKLSGLSRQGIGHIESGRTTPTLLSLLKVAAALDSRLSDMLREAESRQ